MRHFIRCLLTARLRKHRHCARCDAVVFGDQAYYDHAWHCTG